MCDFRFNYPEPILIAIHLSLVTNSTSVIHSNYNVTTFLKIKAVLAMLRRVDRAVIRKLGKIKTLQGLKKFSGWRSRGNLQSWNDDQSANLRNFSLSLFMSSPSSPVDLGTKPLAMTYA